MVQKSIVLVAILFFCVHVKQSATLACGDSPTTCEEGVRLMDNALIETMTDPEAVTVIVLYEGQYEKKNLNADRAAIVTNFCDARKVSEQCIIAFGKKSGGLGRMDIYVKGKRFGSAFFEKNQRSFCIKR